ncbi:MAG TPA: amidase [Candidatus Udaeobacter sp.]|jgi:amidase|nr:amidase [Candidatus Udaeobacter sp.]
MKNSAITVAQSNAFVTTLNLSPTGTGLLDGLCFAVKDVIDLAGWKTGCGNPTWRDSHPLAVANAVCVEQLLRAGARCVGKTICDELAFSLLGENHFYGTPLNAQAPDRVPGGSSSGSAAAVACGLVDFALGTDTGGSTRVPASNCGIFGFRPSHGFISVAGVNSLAPSFDTVGIFAPDADVLARVALVLLACAPLSVSSPGKIHLINDTFALADAEVRTALSGPLRYLRDCFGERICQTSVHDLAADNAGSSFANWIDTFCVIQWAEIKSCLGTWIADARPEFGPNIAASFELTDQLDRRRVAEALQRRKQYAENLQRFLGPNDLLCIPTTPALAPLKGNPPARSSTGSGYYPRTLALTALAGIGRLPQVSLPMAQVGGVPVGLSLLASHGRDDFLLQAAKSLAEEAAVQLNCSDPPRL